MTCSAPSGLLLLPLLPLLPPRPPAGATAAPAPDQARASAAPRQVIVGPGTLLILILGSAGILQLRHTIRTRR